MVDSHYGTVLGPDFDPVPRTILQQPMKEVIRPMQGNPSQSWILGFWILDTGLRILCEWNLDSRFQSLVRFRIPRAVLQISKPRIPHSISMADFPDS